MQPKDAVLSPATREPAAAGPVLPAARMASLVERHADFVWRCLRRMGVLPAQVDDATQEVFIAAALKLERIEPGRERAFLYGVAMNIAMHARRARARSREVAADDQTLEAHDDAPDPEMRLAGAQARAQLDRVLDALPDDLRAVFVLFELEELTMIDIARLLEVPPGTVASRLRRAREEFHAAAARLRAEETRRGGGS